MNKMRAYPYVPEPQIRTSRVANALPFIIVIIVVVIVFLI